MCGLVEQICFLAGMFPTSFRFVYFKCSKKLLEYTVLFLPALLFPHSTEARLLLSPSLLSVPWCRVTARYLVEERIFSAVLDLLFLSALRGRGGEVPLLIGTGLTTLNRPRSAPLPGPGMGLCLHFVVWHLMASSIRNPLPLHFKCSFFLALSHHSMCPNITPWTRHVCTYIHRVKTTRGAKRVFTMERQQIPMSLHSSQIRTFQNIGSVLHTGGECA